MKKLYSFLLLLALPVLMLAQSQARSEGWPANYGGVMLQGFYWDSFSDTQWTNLGSEANVNEISKSFDLIWVPQSGKVNDSPYLSMGYDCKYWLNQNSSFGTEAELRAMINAYKAKNVGIIADVVINHKKGLYNWCDFANETYEGANKTYVVDGWSMSDICSDDECKDNGFNPTGKPDTGTKFGDRDLDHTSANVQRNVKTYLDFLKNEIGYTGFRYDMVLGYSGCYVGLYNDSSLPEFSVGECWADQGIIQTWMRETGRPHDGNGNFVSGENGNYTPKSAAFDFPLKYVINDVFQGEINVGRLAVYGSLSFTGDPSYNRWSVTFPDFVIVSPRNHPQIAERCVCAFP